MMSYRGQIFKIILHILLKNIIYILLTYYLRRQRLVEINNIFVCILIFLFVFTYHVDHIYILRLGIYARFKICPLHPVYEGVVTLIIGKLITCVKKVFTEWNDKQLYKSNYSSRKYTTYIKPRIQVHTCTTHFVCFIPWSTSRNGDVGPFKGSSQNVTVFFKWS
jgi:hypothetical protein